MRVLYFDCSSGISGDMTLAALLDLGLDARHLRDELGKLGLGSEFELSISEGVRGGIRGKRVEVIVAKSLESDSGGLRHGHPHAHAHSHSHEHEHEHEHEHGHGHVHRHEHAAGQRHLADIRTLIESSSLSAAVRRRALTMFEAVARAEAKVHGQPIEAVHFHEVGATDSIVDLVGVAIGLEALGVDRIHASAVEVGGGKVVCEHGELSVPAPATAELLQGIPLSWGRAHKELTTPTGAAILSCNVDEFAPPQDFVIEATGYGLGSHELVFPNLLRVFLGRAAIEPEGERQVLVETNLDDMNPEVLARVEDRLFELGAVDVWRTPVLMKKARLGVTLSVLCPAASLAELREAIFTETTAIGLRQTEVDRLALERRIETVATSWGEVRVKTSSLSGKPVRRKPEHEDCRRIAEAHGLPLIQICERIEAELHGH